MVNILMLVHLWCSAEDFSPEDILSCRQEILECIGPDLRRHGDLTRISLDCFEREIEIEVETMEIGC